MKGEAYQRGIYQSQANKEVKFIFPVYFIREGWGVQNIVDLLKEI